MAHTMVRDERGCFVRSVGDGQHYFEGRTVWFDQKGYACAWIDGRDTRIHVYVWERANGPKPDGCDIHHKDEDKSNWALENLELLTKADHSKTHAGWVKTGGQWSHKPCTVCRQLFPLEHFYPRRGYCPSPVCRQCSIEKSIEWGRKNHERRKEIQRNSWRRNRDARRANA